MNKGACSAVQRSEAMDLFAGRFSGHDRINDASEDGPNDGSEPEQPELGKVGAARKKSGCRAACGIHGEIGHRDADEVNQRETQPDGDRSEPGWGALVGGTQDDHEKEKGQRDLGRERCNHRVFPGREFAETIGGKAACRTEALFATGDEVKNSGTSDGTDDLRDDVWDGFRFGMPSADDEPHRDSRIEMAAGDVSDGVGHGQNGETEGKRDTDKADAELGAVRKEHGREDCATAAAEDQPEGAKELGDQFVFQWSHHVGVE